MSNIPEMRYHDWNNHPKWLTEKQLRKKGLVPTGDPVARVYYISRYVAGHYILLFDLDKATPNPMGEGKRNAVKKARETALRNRTCVVCGADNKHKIKRTPRLCNACYDLQVEVSVARSWLNGSETVILDTESRDLHDEPVQISIVSVPSGEVLLDSLIKPLEPVDDKREYWIDDYGHEHLTAFGVHGISNQALENAPTFAELWPEIKRILGASRVLVYNADYDWGSLAYICGKIGVDIEADITGDWPCVMRWYASNHSIWVRKYRDYKFISLSDACGEQGVDVQVPAHSAIGDCLRTLGLIKAIAAKTAPLDKEVNHVAE